MVFAFVLSSPEKHSYAESNCLKTERKISLAHLVQKGDSLWRIAQAYGLEVGQIMEANRIETHQLSISQELTIPLKNNKNSLFSWPASGMITSLFDHGYAPDFDCNGIWLKSEKNTKIFASFDGKIIFSGPLKNWGKTIVIKHPNNFYTVYAGLKKSLVSKKQIVCKGQAVALPRNKDNLCFELRYNYIPENPLNFLIP